MWSTIVIRGLLLVIFAWTVLSEPSTNTKNGDPPKSQTVGIEPTLLDNFVLFAQYAAAAYWPENSNSTGDLVLCGPGGCPTMPSGNCPRVEAAKAYTTDEFQDTPGGDDHGYIAVDEANGLVVLAFRGAISKLNWQNNRRSKKKRTDLCPDCKIHSGFWDQWTPIRHELVQKVRTAHDDFPNFRLIVTGHSLGAAMATLAAAEIRKIADDPWYLANTELFTFGSPRVGNKHTARFMSEQSSLSYRVTVLNDPVPHVPFSLMGYYHMQPEYWVMRHPEAPEPSDIMVLTGYNNKKGNEGHFTFDKNVHYRYFGVIRGCGNEKKR